VITFEQAMGAMDAPEITELSPGKLDAQDMINLILQRSEIIRDQPNYNRYIRAWIAGDDAPMLTNDKRHFGFKAEGAAYSNLDQTRDFLVDNGVPEKSIDLRNPETDDLTDIKNLDYVFSFISCGFHYPWDTYKTFYQDAVKPKGRIILDLRAHKLPEALPGISEFGFARIIEKAANNTADRVMIAKAL